MKSITRLLLISIFSLTCNPGIICVEKEIEIIFSLEEVKNPKNSPQWYEPIKNNFLRFFAKNRDHNIGVTEEVIRKQLHNYFKKHEPPPLGYTVTVSVKNNGDKNTINIDFSRIQFDVPIIHRLVRFSKDTRFDVHTISY